MGLKDWGAIRADGHSVVHEEESPFWRWGKKLSPWLVILIAIYAAFSYLVKNELHDVELTLSTHSIAIQYLQEDMKTLKNDVGILKKDVTDIKVSLAKIEGHLLPPQDLSQTNR